MLVLLSFSIFFFRKEIIQNVILGFKNIAFTACFATAFLQYRHTKREPFGFFLLIVSLCIIPFVPLFFLTEIPAFRPLTPEFILSIKLIGPWTVPAAGILWSGIFLLCFRQFRETEVPSLAISPEFIKSKGLTPREAEVARLILEGKSYKSLCALLSISMPTVKSHISSIYKKTGTGNRLDLAAALGTFPHTKE
jgi:DNA-binding CsgD family transcriptional regulator